jgi:hypothetical protein
MYFVTPATPPRLQFFPYFDVRERFERRINKDFNDIANDNRSDLFGRYRPGVVIKYGKKWAGELEYQNSSDLFWTDTKNASTDNSDLLVGTISHMGPKSKVTLGRMQFSADQGRLFAPGDFSNTTRSFEGIRCQSKDWDSFAGRIGFAVPRPQFARLGYLEHFSKAYGNTSYFYKHDSLTTGTVDLHSIDQDYTKNFGNWDLNAEGVYQFGRVPHKDHEAWAFHAKARFGKQAVKPFVEINAASGGSSASTDRSFDILYPSSHDKLGVMDLFSWKNINQLDLGAEYSPKKNLSLRASVSDFTLRDPSDSVYNTSGTTYKAGSVSLVDATGASGRHIGREADLLANYAPNKTTTYQLGLGLFDPGSFVTKRTGHDDQQLYGYLSVAKKF